MRFVLLVLLFVSYFQTLSQYRSPLFFDEVNISFNESDVKNNTVNKNGFGIALNAILAPEKQNNLILAFEYNKLQILKPYFRFYGNISYTEYFNVAYKIHNFSMPVTYRLNIGNSLKFFIQTGLFFDWNFFGTKEGYTSVNNNLIQFKEYNKKIG